MISNDVYLRFLALSEALSPNWEDEIDLCAQRLLEVIAVRAASGAPMSVTQAMELKALASPATIHRKLRALMDRNLIAQQFEAGNRRTRYLVLTKNAEKHFERLGSALQGLIVA